MTPPDPREATAHRLAKGLESPHATRALVLAMVVLHLGLGLWLYALAGTGFTSALLGARASRFLVLVGAMHGASIDSGELWRLLSAIFLHADALHLSLNMIALFALGRLCEAVYGGGRLTALFLIAGVCGTTLSWVGDNPLSVGASGGIFGLMGAAIIFGWKHRADLPEPAGRFFRRKLLPWVLFNLGLGLVIPVVDNFGHIGGLIGGCVAAMIMGNRVVPGASGSPVARLAMNSVIGVALLVGLGGILRSLLTV